MEDFLSRGLSTLVFRRGIKGLTSHWKAWLTWIVDPKLEIVISFRFRDFRRNSKRKPVGCHEVDRVTSASFKTVARLLESQEVVADFGYWMLVKLCYKPPIRYPNDWIHLFSLSFCIKLILF